MPKITIGTTKFGETLDRGTGPPIEEPYQVPSTFARQEVINPVTNNAATVFELSKKMGMKRENVVSKCLDYEIKAIKRQTSPSGLGHELLVFSCNR